MFKIYYHLTKPGIIYGNAITAAAGFFLASRGNISVKIFLAMLVGLSFVIASGCVFNNIWDADIDAKMERTKSRAMVTGKISKQNAVIFGIILLTLGIYLLLPTRYSLYSAILGFIVYVFLYTPLKRKTIYATLIGAVAGATPPVVGYAAVANKLDAGAIILFLILVFWQMPHFYAIAIRRLKDYTEAGVPVLPAKKGIGQTKIHMLFYIIAFIIAASALTYFKFTGYIYLVVVLLLGFYWLWLAGRGFRAADEIKWAKKMFLFSLVVLTSLCVIIPIDAALRKYFNL